MRENQDISLVEEQVSGTSLPSREGPVSTKATWIVAFAKERGREGGSDWERGRERETFNVGLRLP